MSEIPLGGPRPDPSDPWFQPFELPPDFAPSRKVEQSIEPSREASVEASPTPVAAPPKVRHRTRASLQPAIKTPPDEIAPPEPVTSSAGPSAGGPAPMSESDGRARTAERSKPGPAADDGPDKRDYEIGFGKPPKASQFRPGKSGNPNGRPKGAKNFATVIAEELQKFIEITEDGRRRKATRLRAMVLQMIKKALSGDLRALEFLVKQYPNLLEANARGEAEQVAELEETDQQIIDAMLAELRAKAREDREDVPKAPRPSNLRDEEEN